MKHKTKYKAMDIKEFELPIEGTIMPLNLNISHEANKSKKNPTPKTLAVVEKKQKEKEGKKQLK